MRDIEFGRTKDLFIGEDVHQMASKLDIRPFSLARRVGEYKN